MTNKLSSDQVSENFCIATDMLIEKQLKKLQFDKTIDAIVINATRASEGIYTVSYGASNFIAYSQDASYKENDTVMVTVPQGNFDNQKMIIGKKVVENENGEISSLIKYESPFSKFIDLTGNLVNNIEISNIIGITANADSYYLNNGIENYTEESSNKFTTISISETKFKYKTIGVRAKFQTLLNQYNLISGNYGLILKLNYKKENDSDNLNKFIIFDSSSFFGNIYNFIFYQSQEEVFDLPILEGYKLDNIDIYPYQQGNFINQQGEYISDEVSNFNILIKDISVYLGISSQEFENDSITLECLDQDLMYDENSAPKKVVLNWIHKDDDNNNISLINKEDNIPNNYTIQLYRKNIKYQNTQDSFMSKYWEPFYGQEENNVNSINNSESRTIEDLFNFNFKPDAINKDKEELCAVILKNNSFYKKSVILTFENIKKVEGLSSIIESNALSIKCDDNELDDYRGFYFCYDKTGKILNSVQTTRKLTAVFNDSNDLFNVYAKDNLLGHSSIKWIFPKNNTMIEPIIDENNYIQINDENSIIFTNKENALSIPNSIKYKIKDYFNYSISNNLIQLEVKKDGITYNTSLLLSFGYVGISGSDYNIKIDWENGSSILDISQENNSLTGTVKLVKNGYDELLNEDAFYEYNWYKRESEYDQDRQNQNKKMLSISNAKENGWETVKIELPENNNSTLSENNNSTLNYLMNEIYILSIVLKNQFEYDLITYVPIALKNSKDNNNNNFNISNIIGPTILRYASDGTINFDNEQLYDIIIYDNSNNQELTDGYWKIITNNLENNNDISLPKLIKNNNNYNLKDLKVIFKYLYEEKSLQKEKIKRLFKNDYDNSNVLDSQLQDLESIFNSNEEKISSSIFENWLDDLNQDIFKNFITLLKEKYPNYFFTFEKYNSQVILVPPKIYFKNTPLCGIQYILLYNDSDMPVFTQPFYIYRDNYPSTTLNKWDGQELILDEENGTILTNAFGAGKKELVEENGTITSRFTGVILGDWSQTNSFLGEDNSIKINTGIYGFHQGAMSYAFKDDGTAFIGKDGVGRIEFDGEKGIIKSANFISSTENQRGYGTSINLKEGKLELYSPISEKDKNKENWENYSLTLSSIGKDNQPFLQISRKRNEIEAITSKYLNQYYDAYDDLKNSVSKIYNNLVQFAQAYITYTEYLNVTTLNQNSLIKPSQSNWKSTTELIPYIYYIMTKFDEEEDSDLNINNLLNANNNNHDNSLIQNFFPQLVKEINENNINETINGVEIDDTDNKWKFFGYSSNYYNDLIEKEENQYEILLKKFYTNPNVLNLLKVNTFIKEYIEKYEINQYVQDSNIINYFFEDVSNLISDDDLSLFDENTLDENTANKQLIKFLFYSLSQKPLISGEKTGLNYYLYNFINFIPIFSGRFSFIKSTQDSLEIIQANINALNSMWTENQVEFFIKDPLSTGYIPVNKNEVYKCYHIQNGNIKYFSNEYWSNASGNNYKMDKDGISTQISSESDFPVYYIQLNNKHIKFNYYYSTFTPVNNTINSENSISNPILTFEKNKIYYYKSNNNDSDKYIPANYCDNNNEYFYTIYNSPNMNDFKNISFFSTNINYYELTSSYQLDYDYDQQPYQNYQFNFVSSSQEDDNLTETYILKSFVLPNNNDGSLTIPFKVGNGLSSLTFQYRGTDYQTATIYSNKIYDIIMRIDSKPQSELGLSKDTWPIQGHSDQENVINEDGSISQKIYYVSLQFVLKDEPFGKTLLNEKALSKYSFLNNDNTTKLRCSTLSRYKQYRSDYDILVIEEKIENLNKALNNLLQVIPLKNRSNYIKNYNFSYLRTLTGYETLNFSLLTKNQEQINNLKELLKQDISDSFIFDKMSWENDLIKIVENGGYITSKDYRPTMISGDKTIRLPTQNQDDSSSNWRQGMKGFIIDLSNNKIILGNNSQIEGVQTQYYPGETAVDHRYFSISTGVNFKEDKNSGRDRLQPETTYNKSYFIRAVAGPYSSNSSLENKFYVQWDGFVYCKSLRVTDNFYYGPHRVQSGTPPSGAHILYY